MNKPIIKLVNNNHRNSEVVNLRFEKDFDLISKVKAIPGAAWSLSKGWWYICIGNWSGLTFENHTPESEADLRHPQELLIHRRSKTTEIYPVGNYYLTRQRGAKTEFSNGVNTHVTAN